MHPERSVALPPSVTSMRINVVGLVAAVAAAHGMWSYGVREPFVVGLTLMLVLSATIAGLEIIFLKTPSRHSTGLDFSRAFAPELGRVACKLVALLSAVSMLGIGYALFPIYHQLHYADFWELVGSAGPAAALVAVVYFVLIDGFQREPDDEYRRIGAWFLGRRPTPGVRVISQFYLGWLVKGFFLPLMFVYLVANCAFLFDQDYGKLLATSEGLFRFAVGGLMFVDVLFAVVGYCLSLRLFDSHIRSTDPTLFGWLVAVVCYEPFWAVFSVNYFTYNADGYDWGQWLANSPLLHALWGGAILALFAIYAMATVAFGLRFSNLTNRGILTNGVYRYSKHPAYISKNLAWWLIAVPFVSAQGVPDAIHSCVLLLGVNGIYFLRARTEERHLSADPTYVQYALAINSRGLLRGLTRAFPGLAFQSTSEGRKA